MRRYHSWLAALGIAAATPGLASAGPLSLFTGDRESRPASNADAKAENTKLANSVAKALRGARLEGYDIQVECRNGEATLLGNIPTAQQRSLATKATEAVPGVKIVHNQLVVNPQQAKAKGGAAARQAPEMAARPVQPKRQPIQQTQFEDAAGGNDLVVSVEKANQAKADEIADVLRSARFGGEGVEGVEIQFQEGVAMISGKVADAQKRNAATDIIRRVPGVRRVDNQLEVQEQVAARPAQRMPVQTASRTAGARNPARQPIRQAQYDEGMDAGSQMGSMGVPPIGPGGNGYPVNPAAMMQGGPGPGPINGMPMSASNPVMYDQPNLPQGAWPAYASYPNYAAVTYPKQYSASAWPYIGPFYPYPQVPLGWRKVQLEWDDGYWQLNFRPRTERWWWFMNYQNW
jgi:osmotically-inducible protein OsmY